MVEENYTSYPATDRSYFAALRKGIHKQALHAEFTENKIAKLDLVVAEITSNLAKHAIGGEVLCKVHGIGDQQYIELISIDKGPGISNLAAMMQDGISTANTLGHGLGSIKRLSDFFSIYSLKDWGTILVSRLYKKEARVVASQISVHSLITAKPPEILSGDGCAYKFSERHFKLLLMDGLGHGPEANKVLVEAFDSFKLCPYNDPAEVVRFLHPPLKKTRGGVGTLVVYDLLNGQCEILGVGNISCKIFSAGEMKNVMSYNGIIGHNIPNTMTSHSIPTKDFKYIILCSDGIKSRWDIAKYPSIQRYDPVIIAAAIYKDFNRQTDDTSVVIIKINRS